LEEKIHPDHYLDENTHIWDHENVAIACDVNFEDLQDMDNMYDIFEGRNSALKRCIYGYQIHQLHFEYTKQFWDAYPDVRKFF
jgi:hypothetical protein